LEEKKEFRSKLENIIEAIELNLPSTPGFGLYKKFLEHAIAHPAKMNTKLLEFLIKTFTREGDVVLDPMAGSGSTGVVGSLLGRNVVQVDIERKFFGWMEEARRRVERQSTLKPKGWIRNIRGDARKLSELLKRADAIVTSPPYSETFSSSKAGEATRTGKTKIHDEKKLARPYTESLDKQQIGNLPHGSIDTIITSPPYAQSAQDSSKSPCVTKPPRKGDVRQSRRKPPINKYSDSPNNIGNLQHGSIDTIITSPPYADSKRGGEADEEAMAERWDRVVKERNWDTWGKTWKTEGRKRALKSLGSGYSESEDNIGNLGYVDSIITSTPYEESMSERRHHTPNTKRAEKLWKEKHLGVYPHSEKQIGAMKKETYLEAMFKVYSEMFKVLKPDGLAVIVIKPFIRNKKVVDLPYHTWLLLKKMGFKLHKLYKLRLKTQSFWRILYYKKYPNVPRINHEYILVVKK